MGVEITETPVTPERVLDAIEKAKSIPKREAA
jgi:hypothetical protein